MARRNDIDWEKIERLYVAGQLTVRQIAEECGVSASSITLKSKKEGWVRNIADAIKERTKAKVAQIDVQSLIEESAQQSAHKSAQTLRKAIEDASDIAANVRLRQRAQIRIEAERSESLQRLLDSTLSSLDGVGDVLKATQAYKNLVDARLKLQDREDAIFGLKEDVDRQADDGPLEISVNLVEYDGRDQS